MQQYAKTDDRTDDILRRIEGIRFKKYVSPLIRNQSVDDSRLSGYLVGHSCQAERVSQHIFCKNLVFIHAKQLFSKN